MGKPAKGSTRNLVEINEDEVSYVKEMLTSWVSKAGLGGALLATVPAAFVGGPALAVFPLIAWAGATGMASLFIPTSDSFRLTVNRRLRKEKRERIRLRFLEKLALEDDKNASISDGIFILEAEPNEWTWHPDIEQYRQQYIHMLGRLDNLRALAAADEGSITEADIAKLEDATIDYLRLAYARKTIRERMNRSKMGEVQSRIRQLEKEAKQAPPSLAAKLNKAREALERTANQQQLLPAQDAALAAQLLHMGETFEELYHRVTADPAGSDLSAYLQQAAEKMSIEEELEWATSEELDGLAEAKERVAQKAKAKEQLIREKQRQAAAAKRKQKR